MKAITDTMFDLKTVSEQTTLMVGQSPDQRRHHEAAVRSAARRGANTRSGCGIKAVKRPSGVVTDVRPPGCRSG